MMTTGEEIFWGNALGVLRDIRMQHLDPEHGAAVDIVRWCGLVRGRPTHLRQTFLERESPALLAYLERLASSGDAMGWRTLRNRIQRHAEVLRDGDMLPCARPWLAATWHALPEFAALGQVILDRQAMKEGPAPDSVPAAETTGGKTGDDGTGGNGGKSGSAGTMAKYRPSPRLALPVVAVMPTTAEEKALGLVEPNTDDTAKTPEGPEGTGGPGGMKGPGGKP
ncbi:hypothetical protein LJR257_003686 [Ensifer adhaerens]